MAYRINHIHLTAPDPKTTAEWYARAFGFKIVSDEVRAFGDRFIRCQSEDGGMMVNISGARTGEALGPATPGPSWSGTLRLRLPEHRTTFGSSWSSRARRGWRAAAADAAAGPPFPAPPVSLERRS